MTTGEPLRDVARDDEHDELRLLVPLAEEHGVRVVRQKDGEILERAERAPGDPN